MIAKARGAYSRPPPSRVREHTFVPVEVSIQITPHNPMAPSKIEGSVGQVKKCNTIIGDTRKGPRWANLIISFKTKGVSVNCESFAKFSFS